MISRGDLKLNVGSEPWWRGAAILHSPVGIKVSIYEQKDLHTDLMGDWTPNPMNESPMSHPKTTGHDKKWKHTIRVRSDQGTSADSCEYKKLYKHEKMFFNFLVQEMLRDMENVGRCYFHIYKITLWTTCEMFMQYNSSGMFNLLLPGGSIKPILIILKTIRLTEVYWA